MVKISVDTGAVLTRISGIASRCADFTPVWVSFVPYIMGKTEEMFRICGNGATGGTHRGVTWEPFKAQYTRKTDGVVVPAWGGVPRIRARRANSTGTRRSGSLQARGILRDLMMRRGGAGVSTGSSANGGGSTTGSSGTVLGRLRPSGARVTKASKLMQDTGRMKAEAGQNRRMTETELVMSCPTGYARRQQDMRPFFFVTDEDAGWVRDLAVRHIAGVAGASTGSATGFSGDSLLGRIRSRGSE